MTQRRRVTFATNVFNLLMKPFTDGTVLCIADGNGGHVKTELRCPLVCTLGSRS